MGKADAIRTSVVITSLPGSNTLFRADATLRSPVPKRGLLVLEVVLNNGTTAASSACRWLGARR